MSKMIKFVLNGENVSVEARGGYTLLDLLKYELRVNSVKTGCETGECGACAVLLNDVPVTSCLVLGQKMEGRRVETLEGLNSDPIMQKLQRRFVERNALQCGYCTPGMLISLYSLFKAKPNASDNQIETAIEGNLCRCGAYLEIKKAAADMKAQVSE